MTTTPEPATSELAAALGRRLTQRRAELGLSRRALAERAGVSNVTLLGLEHGKDNPTLRRVEDIAAIYELDPVELVNSLTEAIRPTNQEGPTP